MKKSLLVVERIEGSWAILETGDGDSFQFPKNLLPQPLKEGMHLQFSIEIDSASAQAAQANMKSLRDSMKQG
ncbi:DUF3006 domain-containing protein [bacterium]|nr:DUF3006 domain-containing protein [candidate division CSSED10-310 bacterium]